MKTTWALLNAIRRGENKEFVTEVGEYKIISVTPARAGLSSVIAECPWCNGRTKLFIWSLNGGGKRCSCGAMFSTGNRCFKAVKVEASSEPSIQKQEKGPGLPDSSHV